MDVDNNNKAFQEPFRDPRDYFNKKKQRNPINI